MADKLIWDAQEHGQNVNFKDSAYTDAHRHKQGIGQIYMEKRNKTKQNKLFNI